MGGHHVAMVGRPGVGKTLLAERLPSILPDLTEAVGERMAGLIIGAFTSTVMAQKHRIERAGASRA